MVLNYYFVGIDHVNVHPHPGASSCQVEIKQSLESFHRDALA